MKLCENCLDPIETRGGQFPIGYERGSQRDPYTSTLDLCPPCKVTLGGDHGVETPIDLAAFHERYVASREVTR